MPAFVPIMFEMTVFFAAHLMVITFIWEVLWPFKQAENWCKNNRWSLNGSIQ
jgi:molybdopterin-containing oxidoreductase family membrane subunit